MIAGSSNSAAPGRCVLGVMRHKAGGCASAGGGFSPLCRGFAVASDRHARAFKVQCHWLRIGRRSSSRPTTVRSDGRAPCLPPSLPALRSEPSAPTPVPPPHAAADVPRGPREVRGLPAGVGDRSCRTDESAWLRCCCRMRARSDAVFPTSVVTNLLHSQFESALVNMQAQNLGIHGRGRRN